MEDLRRRPGPARGASRRSAGCRRPDDGWHETRCALRDRRTGRHRGLRPRTPVGKVRRGVRPRARLAGRASRRPRGHGVLRPGRARAVPPAAPQPMAYRGGGPHHGRARRDHGAVRRRHRRRAPGRGPGGDVGSRRGLQGHPRRGGGLLRRRTPVLLPRPARARRHARGQTAAAVVECSAAPRRHRRAGGNAQPASHRRPVHRWRRWPRRCRWCDSRASGPSRPWPSTEESEWRWPLRTSATLRAVTSERGCGRRRR